ncbi:MAG: SCO family protein [Magnetococcales bacterium]|nr:SCO family protein [Magnetococcales bacterium]
MVGHRWCWLWGLVLTLLVGVMSVGAAQAKVQTDSEVDPALFRIDEQKFLGVKMPPDLRLVDASGRPFLFQELTGQPVVLVFSYYTCDGSCSTVNDMVRGLVEQQSEQRIGQDFKVLTVSFDRHDTLATMQAFRQRFQVPESWQPSAWTFAMLDNSGQIKEITDRFGFKFFWSSLDRTFFHPNMAIILSADGRAARYLNMQATITAQDLKLSLMDAREGKFQLSETMQYLVSLCYSYNFKEGSYQYNFPMFIGFSSLLFGVGMLALSVLIYRRMRGFKGGN